MGEEQHGTQRCCGERQEGSSHGWQRDCWNHRSNSYRPDTRGRTPMTDL